MRGEHAPGERFIPIVDPGTDSALGKQCRDAGRVAAVGRDRQNRSLLRRQPDRKPVGMVFEQNPEKALQSAEYGSVQEHRPPAVLC